MAYLYLAKQVGLAGTFAIWAYVVAKGLFANSPLRLSRAEEVALLIPVGLGVAILLLFGLGLAGALTGPGILAGGGLMLALSCWRLRGRIASGLSGTVRAIACRHATPGIAMIAVVGTVLVPVALNGLTPPMHSDEVRYHLPYALHFVEQGRIAPDLHLRFPFFALNVNLLYAAAIVFGDDVTPHYVHLLLGSLAGLALYVLAAPRVGRVAAVAAVLLFFVTPNFRVFAATAYIDLGLAAFITSAIACLDRARGRPALVVGAGLAFGAALGAKYLALAYLPVLVAWAAFRTRAVPQVARFAAFAVLTGAPWYVYNLVWTGNPIWPFAGEWFGTWPWTAEDLASQTRHLTRERHDRSFWGLLSLPYFLVVDSWRFSIASIPGLLVPGLLALVLLPWWNAEIRPYGILVLLAILGWFLTTPYFRYLTPILPVWCFISVWSVERTLRLAVSLAILREVISESARRRVTYASAAIVVFVAEHHFWNHARWLDRGAVTERVMHRDRFLLDRLPIYGVADHLRRSGARGEVILSYPPSALFSYVRGNRIVGDTFGLMAYQRTFAAYSPLCGDRFLEKLRLEGVSRFVLTRKILDRSPQWGRYFASRLTSEYADQHAVVYSVEPDTARLTVGDDEARTIVYLPASSRRFPRGVFRIINHSSEDGRVALNAIHDAGMRYATVDLALGARETMRFNSGHLEQCAFGKEVPGYPGNGDAGGWWLSLATDLDIEALAFARTREGITTALHEVARTTRGTGRTTIHHVPLFLPGDERSQESRLQLLNPGDREVEVTISGRDDAGRAADEVVRVTLPGGTACRLGANELESGTSGNDGLGCRISSGRLGDGEGGWRLLVSVVAGDVQVMSVVEDAAGRLVNLSGSNGPPRGEHNLPFFLPVPDSDEGPQGLLRIVNHSDESGSVRIEGIDDAGMSHGPVTLALGGQNAAHLDSGDLEAGSPTKGLSEGLGDGDGYWRLRIDTELDVEVLAYARTASGFATSLHGATETTRGAAGEYVHYVPYLRADRNPRRTSWLRLGNRGPREAEITIEGRDTAGAAAPEGDVSLTIPAGRACMLDARALMSGDPEAGSRSCAREGFNFAGHFGDGAGAWSLAVFARGGDVEVLSLLESPAGHLANLSSTNRVPAVFAPGRRLEHLPDATMVRLERWGPRSGRVGEGFNLQPNGNSALWFRFLMLEPGTKYRLYVGSQPTVTYINVDKGLITASLRPDQVRRLTSEESRIPVHLVDPDRGKQLMGHFVVTGGNDAGTMNREDGPGPRVDRRLAATANQGR